MERNERIDARRMRAVLVATAAIAFATVPLWWGGFGGFEPGSFPVPQRDSPVQPAGYAFAIWGPIYVWLAVSAVFGLVRRSDDADWDAPRWPLFLSLAIGAAWIPVAQRSPVWATVLIWAMLALALVALFRAPARDRWLGSAPLALYAGWLTAASLVSLALLGAGHGVLGDATAWAWIAVLAAIGLGTAIQRALPGGPLYGLAVAWALAAIAVRNLDGPPALAILAALGAVALATSAWSSWRAGPGAPG